MGVGSGLGSGLTGAWLEGAIFDIDRFDSLECLSYTSLYPGRGQQELA